MRGRSVTYGYVMWPSTAATAGSITGPTALEQRRDVVAHDPVPHLEHVLELGQLDLLDIPTGLGERVGGQPHTGLDLGRERAVETGGDDAGESPFDRRPIERHVDRESDRADRSRSAPGVRGGRRQRCVPSDRRSPSFGRTARRRPVRSWSRGDAMHGRSHADHAVAERRGAQRPADVVAQSERRHPRPSAAPSPPLEPPGVSAGFPHVAGAAAERVARVDAEPELGEVGAANRDGTGGEHPVDDRGAFAVGSASASTVSPRWSACRAGRCSPSR